ncbi:MAG: nucleoside triphosphate pyrophosphohydrolase [Alphaproteobacteria bacterium]
MTKAHHQQNNKQRRYSLEDLMDVMARLRDPNHGCPWDIKQNFKTIAPYTIEEAYEVADAIERNDMRDLRDELGDLLFQSVYHAQMADEDGHFNLRDVIHDITHKMITRHPHVFGDKTALNEAEVNEIWDEQKQKEQGESKSALDGVTKALPALLRAQKILKKAMKSGFKWPSTRHVYNKIDEEIAEFKEAVQSGDLEHMSDELGDILINVVILAQMHGFNAEEAMRKANAKFEQRFRGMESELCDQGLSLNQASLEQMKAGWQNQKKKERKSKPS